MSHAHKHSINSPSRKLGLAIALNVVIVGVEIAGGFSAGSLSLLSDALHNFSDVFSLVISFLALVLAGRQRSESRTFGYKRAEILAVLGNSAILVVVSFQLFKAVVERGAHSSPVNGFLMMLIASLGLAVNGASALLLKNASHNNLNIRSSYLHLISDALTSLAVIVGGFFVHILGWTWVDSMLTVVIGVFVLAQGVRMLNQAVHILMQNAPEGLDVSELKRAVENIPGVRNIHHVHVWRLADQDVHCEAHINLAEDVPVSRTTELKNALGDLLKMRFQITHATFQFEFNACEGVPLVNP